MPDVFTKKKRSLVMSRIRSKNTKIENVFASVIKKHNIKFERYPKIYGNPDFRIKDTSIVVFIDGCFWHKCPKHYTEPKSRKNFWTSKIERNVKRDKMVTKNLKKTGYVVIRFWEHDIEEKPEYSVKKLNKVISESVR